MTSKTQHISLTEAVKDLIRSHSQHPDYDADSWIRIIELRNEGKTFQAIGDDFGVTKNAVNLKHKKLLKLIKKQGLSK